MEDNIMLMTFLIIFFLVILFLLIVQPQMYEVIHHKKEYAPTHVVGPTYWPITNQHWKGDYKPDGPNMSPRWDPFPSPIDPPRYLPIEGKGTYYMTHNP